MDDIIEKAAVRRFTVGYKKLCKNCPTRLRPRVDTLTEMIMGLSTEDRSTLLAAVAQRIEQEEEEEEGVLNNETGGGLRTPEEVYSFQLAGAKEEVLENGSSKKDDNGKVDKKQEDRRDKVLDKTAADNKQFVKMMNKMQEAREKYVQNECKLAHAERLLQVTALLLAEGNGVSLPPEPDGMEVIEEISELREMTRQELKLQYLKYKEKKSKCERTRAKCRTKRYVASLRLKALQGTR